jgi:DNA-binding transcriptional MocR family regulator
MFVFPEIRRRDLAPYYIDEGGALGVHKESLAELLCAWEGRHLAPDDFTLCPSGGSASLVILAALKEQGIKRVLFETPAYFGTIEQAYQLEIAYELIPTYRRDMYALPSLVAELSDDKPTAVWLTQPRASLGFNQPMPMLEELLRTMSTRHHLVIDEVTDQSFPAQLSPLQVAFPSANIVRIRNFMKGLGLNGLRLSAILHRRAMRSFLVDALESLGGSLDVHSLFAVKMLLSDLPRFRRMLTAANVQVNSLRRSAELAVRGSNVSVNPLVNGYIGSMVADLTVLGSSHEERRARFLEGCRSLRTPVVLGSSFYIAKDPPLEAIRLNFFTHRDQFLRGVVNIMRVVHPK